MWAFGITWHMSFVVCHLLTFHILIFSSENYQPNELKLSRKHIWKVISKECTFCYEPLPNMAILVSDWPIFLNLLLWNRLAKLTETWQEASMEWRLLISSRSVNKYGHHRQFLFLIGRYLKSLLLWNCIAKWTETTCMEGCVLSFLKAEWKVNDTGLVHWASSSYHTAPDVALYCIILLPM